MLPQGKSIDQLLFMGKAVQVCAAFFFFLLLVMINMQYLPKYRPNTSFCKVCHDKMKARPIFLQGASFTKKATPPVL
jgi:hypothetical protein